MTRCESRFFSHDTSALSTYLAVRQIFEQPIILYSVSGIKRNVLSRCKQNMRAKSIRIY